MNLIKDRDRRTVLRKLAKKTYDDAIDLAASDNPGQTVRLLDEGAVVYADGIIDFYIEKGTLSAYYDSLPDDYVGTINLGHMNFAEYPKILGTWTKEDLHLVDIGDGRQALDVDLHLNYEISDVRDLTLMPYDVAVSAEFTYENDRENTDKMGFLCINKLFISDFAIVGDGGNVNSNGIKLKGGNKMEKEVAKLKDAIASLAPEAADAVCEEEASMQVESVAETTESTPVRETLSDEQEKNSHDEIIDLVRGLAEKVETLNTRIEELTAENTTLRESLAAKDKETDEFLGQLKSIKLSLTENPKRESAPVMTNIVSNPIGE